MESLSYVFEDRGFLFKDDTDFQVDGLQRSKIMLNKWDLDPLSVETMEFVEPVPFLGNSGDDTNDQSCKTVQSTSTVTLNSLTELGIRFSSSVSKPNGEKWAAKSEPNGNQFSVENSVLSSPEPTKRARIMRMESPFPTCQVLGCNKDLSSSKDYHKRHKVCDVHSKTAIVVVNGIQQRFCQQCSR